jgi:hypothetical protein
LGMVAFWVWPLFFVVPGLAFFAVDFVFAALGLGALALTYRRPPQINEALRSN